MGDWLGEGGASSSFGLVCEGCLVVEGLFGLVTGASLGSIVTLCPALQSCLSSSGCHSFRVPLSVTGPGLRLGEGGVAALTTQPPRTTWFQPGPRLSYSANGSAHLAFGAAGGLGAPPLTTFDRRPLSKPCLSLFPYHTAPAFGRVVFSTPAPIKLLL